ncbi:MAG: alpha-D-ribose 1-methylphosphonate 5-triphosphate diphosphatase [Rhodobacterales bacterium]|nr:MAG: alpha-D-ribose 1-methylphosphonate 5-triphosphate diphosphatase [Rhodobacterales bacterium]
MLEMTLTGAQVLGPAGLEPRELALSSGQITAPRGRRVDLSGYMILPGIIDMHGDGFERHLAPRRGAMKDMSAGMIASEAELAANGITTGVMAQFYSWEGGLRGPEFADGVFAAMNAVRGEVVTDLVPQLRFETHMLDHYDAVEAMVMRHGIGYVVFNDHLPHERLARGRTPARLTGTALKSGRSPEALLALLQDMHRRRGDVPAALDGLAARLAARGVRLGSHDENTAEHRAIWAARGVTLSEFPETAEAAQAARDRGDGVILGSPNVVRGGSHKGNASAADLVAMGLCDALASDYHYPSLRRAAFSLVDAGVLDLSAAWALLSSGPARLLGFVDRGTLDPGKRADFVVLEEKSRRLCMTVAGGRISYLSGNLAERLM